MLHSYAKCDDGYFHGIIFFFSLQANKHAVTTIIMVQYQLLLIKGKHN